VEERKSQIRGSKAAAKKLKVKSERTKIVKISRASDERTKKQSEEIGNS